ncbi:hypothetical protein AVEN_77261-1 [Araneus ventricosus]|uniref:Uncharacterized protein n=1 Tax=Araneus ventricosus TaxID=182803 RepID=A0A4Y2PIX9_ARAVE|nr:hypothetical protein AVEN_77261-1 [Araneus ventricosus]
MALVALRRKNAHFAKVLTLPFPAHALPGYLRRKFSREKVTKRVTYTEAKRNVKARSPTPGTSYATAVKKMSNQTAPKSSLWSYPPIPFHLKHPIHLLKSVPDLLTLF